MDKMPGFHLLEGSWGNTFAISAGTYVLWIY